MTSISSPTSLASFQYAHASSSKLRQSHITLSPVHGASSPLAVAAVQGDGVWTYDLTTLRPTSSFTVPPSTSFVSSPLSFLPSAHRLPTTTEKGKGKLNSEDDAMTGSSESSSRITLVAIGQGEKVRKGEEGRILWVWRGDEGAEKERLLLPTSVLTLLHVPLSRAAILCVHTNGSISAIDTNLQIRPVHFVAPLQFKGNPMGAEMTHVSGNNVNVTLVSSRGSMIVVQLDLAGGRDIQAKVVKEGSFGTGLKKKDMKAAEVDNKGRVAGIGHDGSILAHSLDTVSKPDQLPTLTNAPKEAIIQPLPCAGLPLALLANASCDLLLCSVSSTLPAVLNVSRLSEVSPTGDAYISHLSIISHSAGLYTVGVVLTHRDDDGGRSVIYTLEVTIPEAGLGINALLGTEVETKKHLKVPEPGTNATTMACDEVVAMLEDLLARGAVQEAEACFESWMLNAERQRKEAKLKAALLPSEAVERIVVAVFSAASKPADVEMVDGDEVDTGVLQDVPRQNQDPFPGPYAAAIMQRLLKARLAKNDMWPGGVVEAGLIRASDWESVRSALQRIPSLPSSTIVSILERARTRTGDSESNTVDFAAVVQDILALPPPGPDYRTALASLSVESCSVLLETYLAWLEEHSTRLPSSLDKWLPSDIPVPPSLKIPSLESIILHSNLLLDARLQTLLSHKPAWDTLEKMQAALGPLMDAQENYRKLRAPIDAVLTLSKREAKRRAEDEAKRKVLTAGPGLGHQKGQLDRKGRGRRYDAGMNEEAVGKWRVEDLVF